MTEGMLDVGTHCAFCRELDFLPFHCSHCDRDFCAAHRMQADHLCPALKTSPSPEASQTPLSPHKSDGGRFFRSLLPDKASVRLQKSLSPEPTAAPTVKSTLNKRSLDKLLRFFSRRHAAHTPKKKSVRSSGGLPLLKRTAKGDGKIPAQNRIYLYASAVEDGGSPQENVPVFVNKMWPVGRVLDAVAAQLGMKNVNVRADTTAAEKLFIYKQSGVRDTVQQLETGKRAVDTLKDLDYVYIIRGSE